MEAKFYVGSDVSKDKVDVAVKEAGTDDEFSPAKRAAKVWTTSSQAVRPALQHGSTAIRNTRRSR
jgi:hypothetical protein